MSASDVAGSTAQDWVHIAETEPWFGVLSAPEFLNENLTPAAKERFYAHGVDEMHEVVATLRGRYPDFSPLVGLDFGTGLGRLAFPMAGICEHVFGLDVAPPMLTEAAAQRDARGIANVTFAETLPEGTRVDWINSYITFQHIAPRHGYGILSALLDRLNPGGFLSVHVTYVHDRRDTTTLISDASAFRFDGETLTVIAADERPVGRMAMYDYDMNRVLFTLVRAGINGITLHATDHGGAHGFWLFGRRA